MSSNTVFGSSTSRIDLVSGDHTLFWEPTTLVTPSSSQSLVFGYLLDQVGIDSSYQLAISSIWGSKSRRPNFPKALDS